MLSRALHSGRPQDATMHDFVRTTCRSGTGLASTIRPSRVTAKHKVARGRRQVMHCAEGHTQGSSCTPRVFRVSRWKDIFLWQGAIGERFRSQHQLTRLPSCRSQEGGSGKHIPCLWFGATHLRQKQPPETSCESLANHALHPAYERFTWATFGSLQRHMPDSRVEYSATQRHCELNTVNTVR